MDALWSRRMTMDKPRQMANLKVANYNRANALARQTFPVRAKSANGINLSVSGPAAHTPH
eukprot:1381365-Pyramimonas_sp.AAC.1